MLPPCSVLQLLRAIINYGQQNMILEIVIYKLIYIKYNKYTRKMLSHHHLFRPSFIYCL
ncbi:hypothetical protein Hdeb2414_s0009g00315051 [Helianthus debilis subsp. tardiflorus]